MVKLKKCDCKIPFRYRNRQEHTPERRRIFEDDYLVDFEVFRKTPHEKLLLKILKSESKRLH